MHAQRDTPVALWESMQGFTEKHVTAPAVRGANDHYVHVNTASLLVVRSIENNEQRSGDWLPVYVPNQKIARNFVSASPRYAFENSRRGRDCTRYVRLARSIGSRDVA